MAVLTVKKYKYIKDENGNKVKVEKTKEEWDRETKKSTAIYYFSERYTSLAYMKKNVMQKLIEDFFLMTQ